MTILSLKHISKNFEGQRVLKDINLTIEEPKILALVAPNGSGKSTLLNLITNLLKPDNGTIYVFGKKNTDTTIFEETTYLQDNHVLFSDLTGMDHVKLIQDVYHLPDHVITDWLQRLQMNDYINKRVNHYSLGMKQHLLFLLAILPQPKLLLLDEPINGLDPIAVKVVQKILIELFHQGTTILFSSHNLAQIDELTKQIVFLYDGKLVSADMLRQDRKCYEFVLEDVDTVRAYFLRNNDAIYEKSMYKFSVSLMDLEYQRFMDWTEKNNIKIMDETNFVESTDELYFRLFGETDDTI